MKYFLLVIVSFIVLAAKGQNTVKGSSINLQSPDQNLTLKFYQKSFSDHKRMMYYEVSYKGKDVIKESALGIQMDNQLSEKAMALKIDQHKDWCENLEIKGIKTVTHDTIWKPVNGESSQIRDHYNETDITLIKDDNPIYVMHVQLRVYNEGVAIRYFFPENVKGTYYNITAENTEFSLPAGTQAWFANWAQAPYYKLPLVNWPGESERPLTLELPNGLFATLAEAQMVDYARTKFKLSTTKLNTIMTSTFGEAQLISPVYTPWRVIMVAEKPGDLIEHDYLILNLNEQSKIPGNTDWIKPGKIIRVMTQTTAAAKANIDFAARQNLQYILFDWKWYGPAFSFNSDATKVAIPDFDLPGIIQYGKDKGIGVWLYVNQQALLAQSDSLFSVYSKWGVKGVKFGFVQVGSHRWTTWVEKAIQQAAASQMMVNIHDDWRLTGEQRTWPNLMTAEGIRGNEEMPDATHNTILPFTRYIAGPADYTICYFDSRIKTTHAHQLALAAIYYSPIQTLFWYDSPSQYHQEPELAFWSKIPTTWDETRVIQGKPGEYITTARRKGTTWFVGSITNNEARSLQVALTFLAPGKRYSAKIYSDDPQIATSTHVHVTSRIVTDKTVLITRLQPSGGEAIYLEEIK
ncbi:glycoside hydrolase family 97 N-terminal domain-containing protein [Mucilaginibacter sabulilitoris]|uniref:Glycoside hydrolase family 97 N-terminal domain-containing protein n=1 Tax=Mucilaginibacter sabulilitoris TaxID=1173583 RepID=A0ABZ0TSL1_9SPHI|nr:glycoside hydrolase family 97 N-terminal domain-containing protein [Mucilaginibacter sabulilitoris]WPU96101.1 glycoside hydrolase family 97 N-terminal domain-containing protein [Mucilaginibacter sabulilitoris]